MQKQKLPVREITVLVLGELLVSLIIVGVYAVLNKFSYAVVAGALLGSAVTVFNFVWLSVSVNRAIDKAMAGRKQGEMSEEEAEDVREQIENGIGMLRMFETDQQSAAEDYPVEESYAIAVNKERTELLEAFNEVLAEMSTKNAEGASEIDRLVLKYMGLSNE